MTLTWFGLLGGAGAWSMQLVLSYLVVGLACGPQTPMAGTVDAVGGPTLILNAISVLAGLLALAATGAAFADWRRRTANGGASLAVVAVALDLLFVAVILVGASAPFVLPTCAR